jgi:CRISPR-associated endonuclease/helicase Cas3
LIESTLVVIVPRTLDAEEHGRIDHSGPYSREDLVAALRWLGDLGGSISPVEVTASTLPPVTRPPLPKLRSADLQTLAMTSDVQAADPDPELYLQDPQLEAPEVSVIARRHLGLHRSVVAAALMACPPRQHELAPVGMGKTLERIEREVRDGAWVVRVDEGSLGALPLTRAGDLRNGDILVVPDGARICTAGVVGLGEASGSPEPLHDVLEEAPPGAARDHVVALPLAEVSPITVADPILGTRDSRRAIARVLELAGMTELATRMRRHRRLSELELTWCGGDDDDETGLLAIRDMSHRAEQVTLVAPDKLVEVNEHQLAVERRVAGVLQALRVRPDEIPGEALLLAARTHDEGKRHPRFQRRMGAIDVPLAKPRPGHIPDRGDGWRHEQLSAAFAADASGGDPLVVTLVAAHHGRGRPLFDRDGDDLLDGWLDCPEPVRCWVTRLFGPTGEYERLRADEQEHHIVHRLAWLEALLRCADMQVSREGG